MTEVEHKKCNGCKCHRTLDMYLNAKGRRLKTCSNCRNRHACDFEGCNFKCAYKSKLTRHKDTVHLMIKKFKCDFEGCNYQCSKNSHLTTHKKAVHLKLKDFVCDVEGCDYKSSEKSKLNRHKNTLHLKIQKIACDVEGCNYKCSTNSNLTQHKKQVHLKIKDFICDVENCNYKCSTNGNLTEHKKAVHLKIKDFACDTEGCGYKCSANGTLTKHKKICTGKLNCSSGELAVMNILKDMEIPYAYDETYDNLKDKGLLRFDFRILATEPLFIEYDGGFHYSAIRMGNMTDEEAQQNLETTQKRDKIKNDYCEKNDHPLLRIPYWEKNNIDKLVREFIGAHTEWD